MKFIDLRSDTVTSPTNEMRKAMMEAAVGDDVFSDDPTMNELEALVAKTLGKEAGVFIPSGTFSNQLALFTHCQQGQEVIVDQFAHIVQHESGASPILSGVQLFTLESDLGIWDLNKLDKMIKKRSISSTETKLICIENAYNGRALPLDYFEKVKNIADKHQVKVHLDGARIFNAALALDVQVKEIAKYADTVSVCLSKGLCAPVGSVLVGPKDFIDQARMKRKIMGGGMRQVGILAAAGIIAVEKMSKRLHIDHENAAYMESLLEEIPRIIIDKRQRDINMVFFDIEDNRKHNLQDYMFKNGVKILEYENGFRFVAHKDIDKKEIKIAINLVKDFFQ
ncbi:low-specificity L-threonine aldolase [Hujiaoplasma nucleasis]|uniref:Low-specificity L-threonine aldolase n=1 Tax=Hujiaoplasma nucleasis TaxID=2725268 RepID=A0A7L6N5Y2_9MOLU|nr:low-specificity L-threonine aldolase [Hujiaoplasma nucleasis]QLY40912.1 low-specificity L-threonine aldolase [Hujiaoplasma nucleasis]